MNVFEKTKAIDYKIEQNKARYDSGRQPAKILALSSGNVGKYEFLKGKNILPEKGLLEKAATIKRFEYSLLGKEFQAQNDNAKGQLKILKYQKKILLLISTTKITIIEKIRVVKVILLKGLM